MKIAIVGGGITGLATYLSLHAHLPRTNQAHAVRIFEAHALPPSTSSSSSSASTPAASADPSGLHPSPAPASAPPGAGLGVSPNGMRALRRFAPRAYAALRARGYGARGFEMRARNGWRLGWVTQEMGWAEEGDGGKVVTETAWMVGRGDLWAVLRAEVERVGGVIEARGVEGVEHLEEREGRAVVTFKDGDKEEFDLVIGADGVRSVVRKAVVGDDFKPFFNELFGVGGFVPASILPTQTQDPPTPPNSRVVMTFSGNGFFGYAPCTPSGKPGASSDNDEDGEPQKAFWWSTITRASPDTRSVSAAEIRRSLQARYRGWADPAVHAILRHEDEQPDSPFTTIPVATWLIPAGAPSWANDLPSAASPKGAGTVVLAGDAAHALPSSSGQGVSQALEDAWALGRLLAVALPSSGAATEGGFERAKVRLALRRFVRMRKPHVEKILAQAEKMGDHKREMGWVQEMLMYLFLKIIFTFFPGALAKQIKNYDVDKEIEKVLAWTPEE